MLSVVVSLGRMGFAEEMGERAMKGEERICGLGEGSRVR